MRQTTQIKIWMLENAVTMRAVARKCNCHDSLVSHTVHGRKNSRRILRELVRMGCPSEILGLPEDMRGET